MSNQSTNVGAADEPVIEVEKIETVQVKKKPRKRGMRAWQWLLLGIFVLALIIWSMIGSGAINQVVSNAPAAPRIKSTPGGEIQRTSEVYRETLNQANEQGATAADEAGRTFIPTPTIILEPIDQDVEAIPEAPLVQENEAEKPEDERVVRKRPVTPELRRKTANGPEEDKKEGGDGQAKAEKPPENPYIALMSDQMNAVSKAFLPPESMTQAYAIEKEEGEADSTQTSTQNSGQAGSMSGEQMLAMLQQAGAIPTEAAPAPVPAPIPPAALTPAPPPVQSARVAGGAPAPAPVLFDANGNPVTLASLAPRSTGGSPQALAVDDARLAHNGVAGTGSVTEPEPDREASKVYIAAGDILYGEVIATVSSDYPTPVMVDVTVGKFKGARLKGTFQMDQTSSLMIVQFSQMTMDDVTVNINAIAVDGYSADTAIRSGIDRRYLQRYLPVFASTFLAGLADGLGEPEKQILRGPDGEDEVVEEKRTTQEAAWNGVAQATAVISEDIAASAPKGPKVTLVGGYPVGILFFDDLRENPQEENRD